MSSFGRAARITRETLQRDRERRERERLAYADQLDQVAALAREAGYTRVALALQREAADWRRPR